MYYKNNVLASKDEQLTSGFGNRVINGITELHTGCDFVSVNRQHQTLSGVDVIAIADGTISEVIDGNLVGWTVAIQHEGRILSRYQHMRNGSVVVKVGDEIRKGTKIGVCGNSGRCVPFPTSANPYAGTHLHFAIKTDSTAYNNGTWVDPLPYLRGEKIILSQIKKHEVTNMSKQNSDLKQIQVTEGKTKYVIDGKPFARDTIVYNDTAYVPAAEFARALGATAVWDEKTNITTVVSSK